MYNGRAGAGHAGCMCGLTQQMIQPVLNTSLSAGSSPVRLPMPASAFWLQAGHWYWGFSK